MSTLASSASADYANRFARKLLMPTDLLPARWEKLSSKAFADLFEVPEPIAQVRQQEILG
jgi:Zn-dependent peptidase ImmA (M78 family)